MIHESVSAIDDKQTHLPFPASLFSSIYVSHTILNFFFFEIQKRSFDFARMRFFVFTATTFLAALALPAADAKSFDMPDQSDHKVYRRLQCSACRAAMTEVRSVLLAEHRRGLRLKRKVRGGWALTDMAVYDAFEKVCETIRNDYGLAPAPPPKIEGFPDGLPEGISFGGGKVQEKFVRENIVIKSHMIGDHLGKMCKQLWDGHEEDVLKNLQLEEEPFKREFCSRYLEVCDKEHEELIARDEL
eukprot:TRINITY_DN159_c0_g1_i4.p1 TRINITY_DN159_c0_g1~~TRINITY_DN159_c0_g1_i4.p1  ORF type:complete len:244 (-),score=47.96 TRINITY_DN159_c0_g1_i4:115-846(-)